MYVHVRATPGAKKELVTKVSESEFHIAVRERAERNQANGRIMELLGMALHVPVSSIKMLTGHRSPSKIFTIDV